jgi:hypothetical protein
VCFFFAGAIIFFPRSEEICPCFSLYVSKGTELRSVEPSRKPRCNTSHDLTRSRMVAAYRFHSFPSTALRSNSFAFEKGNSTRRPLRRNHNSTREANYENRRFEIGPPNALA